MSRWKNIISGSIDLWLTVHEKAVLMTLYGVALIVLIVGYMEQDVSTSIGGLIILYMSSVCLTILENMEDSNGG